MGVEVLNVRANVVFDCAHDSDHGPGYVQRCDEVVAWLNMNVARSQIRFVQWCVWAHFEHVVSPSRPEEQEVDYEVMARDYVKMAHWDYRSGNRTPSQASPVP
uniref:Uncharacterized protein n=1 Tax=Hyaloperonospora arabidopsidis (strain Emoy2) TaxID=559515 RepID=M4BGL4_HYAAE